jgi:hypothetical protein
VKEAASTSIVSGAADRQLRCGAMKKVTCYDVTMAPEQPGAALSDAARLGPVLVVLRTTEAYPRAIVFAELMWCPSVRLRLSELSPHHLSPMHSVGSLEVQRRTYRRDTA